MAAGLKITPYNSSRSKQQQQGQQAGAGSSGGMASSREGNGSESLSESWLPHSKPSVPNYAHAGVLLALGLNGHLSRLSWTDLYRCVGCLGAESTDSGGIKVVHDTHHT